MRYLIAICSSLFLLAATAQPGLRPLPQSPGSLSDQAGLLSADEAVTLSRALEDILERTRVRVLFVIAETTLPEEPEEYTERLARRWTLEGRLDPEQTIFVVMAMHERKMKVMRGNALVSLDAELAGSGAVEDLPALFADGRYFEGLMRLSSRLLELIVKHKAI